ncbi:HlyD family secretion protein [Candidatus Binatia bacterium]|nr:HlyD family secretion protein [Candidatus Binatia bacterium]
MRHAGIRLVRVAVVVALVAAAAWAVRRAWQEQHRYPHSRDAYVRANVVGIAAQIDGPITELFVKDNQHVRKGEILFRIERGPYEAVVARAQGKVGRAEAEVFNTRQILQRSERLARDQFVSREKLDSDLAAVRAAEAEVELARAELWAAELSLSYTEVPAPADGSVTNFLVRVGTYVKRGQELFALVEDKTWWVSANFMETYLRDVRPGQRAWISVDMYPGRIFPGVVEGISAGIYQVDGETTGYGLARVSQTLDWVRLAQRFPVRVTFLEQPYDVPLRSGANAEVTIDADLGRAPAAAQADLLP